MNRDAEPARALIPPHTELQNGPCNICYRTPANTAAPRWERSWFWTGGADN